MVRSAVAARTLRLPTFMPAKKKRKGESFRFLSRLFAGNLLKKGGQKSRETSPSPSARMRVVSLVAKHCSTPLRVVSPTKRLHSRLGEACYSEDNDPKRLNLFFCTTTTNTASAYSTAPQRANERKSLKTKQIRQSPNKSTPDFCTQISCFLHPCKKHHERSSPSSRCFFLVRPCETRWCDFTR